MCRKSISKLENIRPRLEQAYKDALAAEKAAIEKSEQVKEEQQALKVESERLQKLKSEQSPFDQTNNSSLKSSTLNTTLAATSCFSHNSLLSAYLPTCNTLPNPIHLDKETNYTLKAIQERMGISSLNQSQSQNTAVYSVEVPPIIVAPKYHSENGEALRPVHVPQCLISKFLRLASQNTNNNLETCGVLAGKLHRNEFTITCLIIPKQVATSDTCAMINEEEIITAQDSLDIMSLGWIHVIEIIVSIN